jgi:ATP-dependent RNA helicase RhlE
VSEEYVHRIGRTGRADHQGTAVSLVCIDERELLKDIERLLKYTIPAEVIPGYEPDPSVEAEPIFKGRNNSKQGQRGDYQLQKASDSAQNPKRIADRKHTGGRVSSQGAKGEDRGSTSRKISRKHSTKAGVVSRWRNTEM